MKNIFLIILMAISITCKSQIWNGTTVNATKDVQAKGSVKTNNIRPVTVSEPDFEIILIPDTQKELENNPPSGRSIFQWVKDNKVSQNIKAVIGLGDITDDGTVIQMDTADKWYDLLDDANVPYVPTIGNHDYNDNLPATRNASRYHAVFGDARLSAKSWWGGSYHLAKENFFINVNIGSRKYSIISLEYWPRVATVAWADSVLYANADREFIYVTHAYITAFGERSTDTSMFGNNVTGQGADYSGQEQWDNFVRKHKNISFVFSGHFTAGASPLIGYTRNFTDIGDSGNVVHQLFADWQVDTSGGNGFFVRLKFRPSAAAVDVSYYSAYVNRYDDRVQAFTYQYPTISEYSDVGIMGKLIAGGTARFDSDVHFRKLTKGRFPYIFENGIIKDTSLLSINQTNMFVNAPGFTTSTAIAASDSNANVASTAWTKLNFIQNQLSYAQAARFFIRQQSSIAGVVSAAANGSYLSQGLGSNLAVALQVITDANNYGFVSVRASVNSGGPYMNFYKTRSTDASTRIAPIAGDQLGRIAWWTANGAGAVILPMSIILTVADTVGAFIKPRLGFFISSADIGSQFERWSFHHDGTMSFGNTALSTSAVLDVTSTTKGFAPPRMFAFQRLAIPAPVAGLLVFDTDSARYMLYSGVAWKGLKYTTDDVSITTGEYDPTLTTVTNITSNTSYSGTVWVRTGNYITVTGQLDLDPTAIGAVELGISLPVSSSLVGGNDLGGTAVSEVTGEPAVILCDGTNDRAALKFTAIDTGSRLYKFSFTYKVL